VRAEIIDKAEDKKEKQERPKKDAIAIPRLLGKYNVIGVDMG